MSDETFGYPFPTLGGWAGLDLQAASFDGPGPSHTVTHLISHPERIEDEGDIEEIPPLVGDKFPGASHLSISEILQRPLLDDMADARRSLESLMVPAATLRTPNKSFVPSSSLQQWLDAPETSKLWGRFEEVRRSIPKAKFVRVLAILLLIDKSSSFLNFLDDDLSDDCLPLERLPSTGGSKQIQSTRKPGMPCEPFETWNEREREAFLSYQWTVLAPMFRDGMTPWQRSQHSHYVLEDGHPLPLAIPDETILPFTQVDYFNSGGFSTVYRVQIHESHRSFPSTEPRFYALKQLRHETGRDLEQEFESEARVLLSLNRKPHTHIVTLLASWKRSDEYCLLFPWADSDLFMYWNLHPQPQRDRATASWVSNQFLGLCDALHRLHSLGSRSDQETHWGVRHGDIKPSNILCFGSGTSCTLKLADFGLSCLTGDKQMERKPTRYTPTYRAPEFALPEAPIGLNSDIFSMGCVFLETITWYLLGSLELGRFARLRADEAEERAPTGDAFFELAGEFDNNRARLKPGIRDWISLLQNHRHSSRFTDDLLSLVLDKMLVVQSSLRASASDVLREMMHIRQVVDNDDLYVTSREARGLDFGDTGDWDICLGLPGQDHNKNAPFVPSSDHGNSLLTVSSSQVHSRGHPDDVNSRKRKSNDEDTTASHDSKRKDQGRFACPYHKAGRAGLSRACNGPGFRTFSRLKEHLRRDHAPASFKNPHLCGRCQEGFESQEHLVQHQRQPPCLIKAHEIINGQITLEQAINLRSVKRRGAKMTEEDQWFEAFKILFPLVQPPLSAYHEEVTVSSLNTINTEISTDFSEYKNHLRYMSESEQLSLGEKLGKRMGITNTAFCKMFATAFREQQLEDIQEFDRKKAAPVYSIPIQDDGIPKDLVLNPEDGDAIVGMVDWEILSGSA